MPREQYRFKARFRLRHPAMDMDSVSREMRVEPIRSWTAGMQCRTPRGLMLDGFYEDSYWCSQAYSGDEDQLIDVCNALIDLLEANRVFLETFSLGGGTVELIVAIFLGWRSGGPTFDWQMLRRLGDLRCRLSLEIYNPDDRPHVGQDDSARGGS